MFSSGNVVTFPSCKVIINPFLDAVGGEQPNSPVVCLLPGLNQSDRQSTEPEVSRTRVWWHPPLLCMRLRYFQFVCFMIWNHHCTFFLGAHSQIYLFLPSSIAQRFCLPQHKHVFRLFVQLMFIKFSFLFQACLNLTGAPRCCWSLLLLLCSDCQQPAQPDCP